MNIWSKVIFLIWHVSKNSILTILRATPVSKGAGLDNLSGHILKNEVKRFSKPISDSCNLWITSELPTKVATLEPLYKEGFLTLPRSISLLPLISRITGEV